MQDRLEHFPISFFTVVMGLAGLTIAWTQAQVSLTLDWGLTVPMVMLTVAVFLAVTALYAAKLVRHRGAVVAELRNPIKLNFFPAISISLVLLAIASLPISAPVARMLWLVGTTAHLILTFYILDVWLHHSHFQVQHMNPAWFIPVVGNVLVPIAGVPLGYAEISWLFFSVGILFWIVLLAVIFNRVLFHNPLPEKLMPTFFILIAPPAVGFMAYLRLTGELDPFARVLYFGGLFLTALLLTQGARFAKLKFYLSWWAYSFPLAAITIASFLMADATGIGGYRVVGIALLALLTLMVLYLVIRTVQVVHRHGICVPDD
jgi:tellurite resistance protein